MKTLKLLFPALFIFIVLFSCSAQSSDNELLSQTNKNAVKVYYFHFTRRCATCNAVETESKKALESIYPEQIQNGRITFLSVNIEETKNKSLAKELKVSGQTLLIVKGEKQTNLTNLAFMYARSNPKKLKEEIKKAVENL